MQKKIKKRVTVLNRGTHKTFLMKKVNCFLISFSIFVLLNACNQPVEEMKPPVIPLRDFFKNPEKTGFKISPDGKYFSYLAPLNNRMNIYVQKIGKDFVTRITNEIDRDIRIYFWANENRILFLKDIGGDENFKLFGVNIDGSNFKVLTDFEGVMTQIIDKLEDIPEEIIIGLNKRNPEIFDAYRLNIVTGEMNIIAENPGNIVGWLADHNGKLRVAITSDGVNKSMLYRETEQDEFKAVLTTSFKESVSPLFFTFDNKNVYASSNLGRDKSAIVEFSFAQGKEINLIYQNPGFDVSDLSYSRKRKVLKYGSYTSWKREKHFFDDETKQLFEKLGKSIGKYEIEIQAYNKNEDKYIIRTYSDRSLGAYYLYDINTGKLEKITDVGPWLNEDDLAEMKPVKYQSRDGLTIHGYLTLPKGVQAKNLPVVINVHGGPWHRDVWGYNPEVQFLVNRGFAVLQMNFRGSTGYGKKFWEASFKQWGRAMQDDVTDGVNWLIEQEIADKDRIAIYGGSYGGYVTLAGLTFTPEIYACGVDYVGISSMFTFMKSIPPYWKPFLDMIYEMVGDPVKDSLMLAEVSPALHADKIKVPLFIAQGANDPRVNKEESDQMVQALKDRGIDVEYLVKENEGHGFRNEENRFEFYEAMEKFLKKHIGTNNDRMIE